MSTSQPALPSPTPAQLALNDMGRRLVDACPDFHQMAREVAIEVLTKHTDLDVDPDNVDWLRFDTSVSSPRTFTGWQHLAPPIESMTLPQLAMRRFRVSDQEAADNLQQMGGFYLTDASAKIFDETNEVRMLPADVMNDFWAIDFKSRYDTKLDAFWRDCADDFRTLSKVNFLAKALEDRDSNHLTEHSFQTIIAATVGDYTSADTLAMLSSQTTPPPGLRVCTFDIAGYEASDILRIVDLDGRQYLYVAGEVNAFHVFETPEKLHWWVLSQTNHDANRARFLTHFPLSAHPENEPDVGLNNLMDLLFTTWGNSDHSMLNQNDRTLSVDAFTYLRDTAKARMITDAALSLRSNADLRKHLWIGYLNAFSRITGPLAAIDWPIALAAVGAGITDMGMNIDQAVNGRTTADRKAGVMGALLETIDILVNILSVLAASAVSTAENAAKDTLIIDEFVRPNTDNGIALMDPALPSAPEAITPADSDAQLSPFETNVLLDGFTPLSEGRMRGIYMLDKGETYISLNDGAYAVRYVGETKSWVIVNPDNPFSFYDCEPVRLNSLGDWELVAKPRLRGGKPDFSLPWGRNANSDSRAAVAPSPYDVPTELKPKLAKGANDDDHKVLSGERVNLAPGWSDPYVEFRVIRKRLVTDASAFYEHLELPPRPEIPPLEASGTLKSSLKSLYKKTSGLVIGESHGEIGSKQFLIDNMRLLVKLKVKTLYMEHLLTDFHQLDLDEFARTGKMSENLKNYLATLDEGHHTDPSGKYTFLSLIKAANENHIRIQSIDCMASYRLNGLDGSGALRQRMMNYFAHTIIQTDAPIRGSSNWIALVGNSHANTFDGVPAVSELEGAIGLRVEDVGPGKSSGLEIDPGQHMRGKIGAPTEFVKSDLRLQMAIPTKPRPLSLPQDRLPQAGMFTVDSRSSPPVLIHRAGDGSIVRTEIKTDHSLIYIERPKWTSVNNRRYDSIRELVVALERRGMTHVVL